MRDLHRFSNLPSEDKLDRLERLNSITCRAYSVRFSLDSHQKQRAYGEEDLVTMLVVKLRNIYERSKHSMVKFTFLKLSQKSPNLKFLTDILIENEKKTWLRKLMECSVRVSRYHTLQKQRLSREKRRQLAYMLIGNLKSKLTIAFYQLRNNLLECLQPEEKRQIMNSQRQRIDKNESKLKNTKLGIKMLESLYNSIRTKYIELALDLIKKTDARLPAYPVKLYTEQPAYRPRERITGNHRDLSSSYTNTGHRGSEFGSITNRSEQSDSRVIRNKALMDRIQQVKLKGMDTVRTINEQVKLRELTKTSASQTEIVRGYVMKYVAVQVHCAMRVCFNKLTENCAEAQRNIERQDSRKFIIVNEMFSKLMRAQDSKKEKVITKIMHLQREDFYEKGAIPATVKNRQSVKKENKYSFTDVEKSTEIKSISKKELELAQREIKMLKSELQASQGREASSQQSARQEVELVRAKYQTECEKRTNEAQEALANLDQAETALRRLEAEKEFMEQEVEQAVQEKEEAEKNSNRLQAELHSIQKQLKEQTESLEVKLGQVRAELEVQKSELTIELSKARREHDTVLKRADKDFNLHKATQAELQNLLNEARQHQSQTAEDLEVVQKKAQIEIAGKKREIEQHLSDLAKELEQSKTQLEYSHADELLKLRQESEAVLKREVEEIEAQLAAALKEVAELRKSNVESTDMLKATKIEKQSLEIKLSKAINSENLISKQLDDKQKEWNNWLSEKESLLSEHKQELQRLKKTVENSTEKLVVLEASLEEITQTKLTLEAEKDGLEKQVREISQAAEELKSELQASQGREASSQQSARQEVELVRAKYQTECEKRTNEAQEALANLDQAQTAMRRYKRLNDSDQSDIFILPDSIATPYKARFVELQYSQLPSLVLQLHSSSTLSISTLNITLLTAYIYSPTPTCPSSSFSPNTTFPTSPSPYLCTLLTRILVKSTTHHAQSLHTAFSRLRLQRVSADLQTATDINVYHCRRLVKLNQTLSDMRKIDDRIAVMPGISFEGQMASSRVSARVDTVDKQCETVCEIDENDRNGGQIHQNNHGNVERIENSDKIEANYQNNDPIEFIDGLQIMEWYSCPPGIDVDDDSQSDFDIDMRKDAPSVLESPMNVIGQKIISVELPIAKRLKYFSKLTRATRILERSLTRFSFNLIKS